MEHLVDELAEAGERWRQLGWPEPRIGLVAGSGLAVDLPLPSAGRQPLQQEREVFVPPLVETLAALKARRLDDGAPGFDPSNLEVTSVDAGSVPARPAAPAGRARLEIGVPQDPRGHRAQVLPGRMELRGEPDRCRACAGKTHRLLL